jgi:hypothetical protein
MFPSRIILDIRKTAILNGQNSCNISARCEVETAFGIFLDSLRILEYNLEHLGRSKKSR